LLAHQAGDDPVRGAVLASIMTNGRVKTTDSDEFTTVTYVLPVSPDNVFPIDARIELISPSGASKFIKQVVPQSTGIDTIIADWTGATLLMSGVPKAADHFTKRLVERNLSTFEAPSTMEGRGPIFVTLDSKVTARVDTVARGSLRVSVSPEPGTSMILAFNEVTVSKSKGKVIIRASDPEYTSIKGNDYSLTGPQRSGHGFPTDKLLISGPKGPVLTHGLDAIRLNGMNLWLGLPYKLRAFLFIVETSGDVSAVKGVRQGISTRTAPIVGDADVRRRFGEEIVYGGVATLTDASRKLLAAMGSDLGVSSSVVHAILRNIWVAGNGMVSDEDDRLRRVVMTPDGAPTETAADEVHYLLVLDAIARSVSLGLARDSVKIDGLDFYPSTVISKKWALKAHVPPAMSPWITNIPDAGDPPTTIGWMGHQRGFVVVTVSAATALFFLNQIGGTATIVLAGRALNTQLPQRGYAAVTRVIGYTQSGLFRRQEGAEITAYDVVVDPTHVYGCEGVAAGLVSTMQGAGLRVAMCRTPLFCLLAVDGHSGPQVWMSLNTRESTLTRLDRGVKIDRPNVDRQVRQSAAQPVTYVQNYHVGLLRSAAFIPLVGVWDQSLTLLDG
jgi:hypothetical protein